MNRFEIWCFIKKIHGFHVFSWKMSDLSKFVTDFLSDIRNHLDDTDCWYTTTKRFSRVVSEQNFEILFYNKDFWVFFDVLIILENHGISSIFRNPILDIFRLEFFFIPKNDISKISLKLVRIFIFRAYGPPVSVSSRFSNSNFDWLDLNFWDFSWNTNIFLETSWNPMFS